MKTKRLSIIYFFIWLISISLSAQTKTATVQKKVADASVKTNLNYEYALNDPYNVRIYTLKNGLKAYLSVYKNAPRIQTMISVKAGSKNDPSDATGLAHYLEHMLFKGTDKYGTKNYAKEKIEIAKIEELYEQYRKTTDEKERKKLYRKIDSISAVAAKYAIANEYDKMVAAIGAQNTNAFTSFDKTVYINDIPSNQVDNWLKIESERFRKPVMRLFHTELEAVYEEKNRGLDSDNNKAFEAIFEALFPKNNYGTQTTIGTIEHLKNPSLKEIQKYYDAWYVPNNMAIIMSGDFDPDKVIVQIEKYFGAMPSKPLSSYVPVKEEPIKERKYLEVLGPDPESVNICWRFEGMDSQEAEMMELIALLLFNQKAGLFDINLNQSQKVLDAFNWFYPLKDYGVFVVGASPKQNQKMEEVEQLLISQIELLQKGQFADWLLEAVITDMKLNKTKELEVNYARANFMSEAFVNDIKWQKMVDRMERISKITKQDVVNFAKEKLSTKNYVVLYKKLGEDKNVVKVEKPEITPVEVDRDNTSPFVQQIYQSKTEDIKPVFIDFEKDIKKSSLNSGLQVLYNKNSENKLFELYYKFEMGFLNDKVLPVAIDYLKYAGTSGMSAAKVREELFRLGCSFEVYDDSEDTWVSLSGLSDNFEEALRLFEKILNDPVVEEESLKNLKEDIIKNRSDKKLDKGVILNYGLVSYARFGPDNPFKHILSEEELNKLTTSDVRKKIQEIATTEHRILFYGPQELDKVMGIINKIKQAPPSGYKQAPPLKEFKPRETVNEVYVADFDMKQAEIMMLTNVGAYKEELVPIINLYNSYFGDGMSSVVFQDLRESKALAYSAYSSLRIPNKPNKPLWNYSYIGSQVDKLPEAMQGMCSLLNKIPVSQASFEAAKENILQEISSDRINKSRILFTYIDAMDMGQTSDIRKQVFQKVSTFKFDDVKKFHANYISNKNISVLVIGKKENLDFKVLEKYGPVKVLTLQELFGY